MHELHAADKIINKAIEFGKLNKLSRIVGIHINLGRVVEHGEEIKLENLKFNVEHLSKGTIAEGANLYIKNVEEQEIKITEIEGE